MFTFIKPTELKLDEENEFLHELRKNVFYKFRKADLSEILSSRTLLELEGYGERVMLKETFDEEGYESVEETFKETEKFFNQLKDLLSMTDKKFDYGDLKKEGFGLKVINVAKNIRRNRKNIRMTHLDSTAYIEAFMRDLLVEPGPSRDVTKAISLLFQSLPGREMIIPCKYVIAQDEAIRLCMLEPGLHKRVNDWIDIIYPNWLGMTKSGKPLVDESMLGQSLLARYPIERYENQKEGARWDEERKIWRFLDKEAFIQQKITEELDQVGAWDNRTLRNVSSYINVKSYKADPINPFQVIDKPHLVRFKDGVYNFETNELLPHDPSYHLFQERDIELAEALSNGKKPVKVLEWLDDLTQDKQSSLLLCEMIGYCFYHSYAPFQVAFFLSGAGQNGKSTFINFVQSLINEKNISAAPLQDLDTTSNRFATYQLVYKEVNMFPDLAKNQMKNTGTLKSLVGEDTISIEKKGEDGFAYRNYAKLIFSANKLPGMSDYTFGMSRRLVVIPFNTFIDKAFIEKHDLEAIQRERNEFTLYCLRAFWAAYKRGSLTISEKSKAAKDKWLNTMDSASRFLQLAVHFISEKDARTQLNKVKRELFRIGKSNPKLEAEKAQLEKKIRKCEKEFGISTRELYQLYTEYCKAEKTHPIGKQAFFKTVEERDVKRKRYAALDTTGKKANVDRFKGVFLNEDYKEILDLADEL